MRLNINLASTPYEDLRRITSQWIMGLVVLALVTAGLCFYAVKSYRESRDVNQQIANLQKEIRALDNEKQSGIALLNRADNKTTADQSKYLNQLIARKAFSWTRVFMDLEKLMPPGLHVVSVTPELNKANQLLVRMKVGGTSRDRAIELVRRMEQSPTFKQAQVLSESVPSGATAADAVEFEIASVYVPLPIAESVQPTGEGGQAAPEPKKGPPGKSKSAGEGDRATQEKSIQATRGMQ